METFQAMKIRKSYRSQFKEQLIPREDLRAILEAGTMAPSGCNMQTCGFIGIDDPALVRKLAEIYGREWALSSTAAILILTKETPTKTGVSYHIQDYSAAAQNISLAAADKGYQTVWIEGQILGEKAKEMGNLLQVPEDLTVAIYLPLGVPATDTPRPQKKPMEERAWFNGYQK